MMIWVILKAEWRYLFEGTFAESAFQPKLSDVGGYTGLACMYGVCA